MINLYPTIIKLEKLHDTLNPSYPSTVSFEAMMEELARFKVKTLEIIIQDLRDQQLTADSMKLEIDGYEQLELNAELEGTNTAA